MRLYLSRHSVSVVQPRRALVLSVKHYLGAISGRTQRLARLARISRERFERLDPDQQVREVGEW